LSTDLWSDEPREDRPCHGCAVSVRVMVRMPKGTTIRCQACQEKHDALQREIARQEREAEEAAFFKEKFAETVGVPKRYAESTLENWRGPLPKDESGSETWAREWIENPTRNVVLSGGAGSGKTHLGIALLRGLWNLGRFHWAYFYPVPMLNSELLEDMRENSSRTTVSLVRSRIVMFDDVGRLRETKFASEELATVLYQRHANEKIGIFTTNRAPRTLYEGDTRDGYLGDAPTWSRVLEGAIVVTDFPKKDMRLTNQPETR